MRFFYAKNESGQALNRDQLWDKLDPDKTLFVPTREGLLITAKKELVGFYHVSEISAAELHALAAAKSGTPDPANNDLREQMVGDLRGIDPKRYREFAAAFNLLKEQFKMPWQPGHTYERVGDRLEVLLSEGGVIPEMVTPSLTVLRSDTATRTVVGLRITGLMENLLGPGDHDNKAMIVNYEVARKLMEDIAREKVVNPEYEVAPSLAAFILESVRHWPTLKSFTWVETLTREVPR